MAGEKTNDGWVRRVVTAGGKKVCELSVTVTVTEMMFVREKTKIRVDQSILKSNAV